MGPRIGTPRLRARSALAKDLLAGLLLTGETEVGVRGEKRRGNVTQNTPYYSDIRRPLYNTVYKTRDGVSVKDKVSYSHGHASNERINQFFKRVYNV
jgi:hypothetical protein